MDARPDSVAKNLSTGELTSDDHASGLNQDAIRNHYDRFAWAYRLYWGRHLHHGLFENGRETPREAQQALLQHCAARAAIQAGANVVDVGCGYGGTAKFLADKYSCSVLGLTLSPAQFKIARRLPRSVKGAGSLRFELADAESYPFPDANFDLVWNMESLGHFFHKANYLAKVHAALKPGGRFLFADWTGSMKDLLIRQIAEAFFCPELLTADEYGRYLRSVGMNVICCEPLARRVAYTWDICARRLHAVRWLFHLAPPYFDAFRKGVELMREGFRSGQLEYTLLIAERSS